MATYASTVADINSRELARAWPRFWARIFDTAIYVLPVTFVLGFAFPSLMTSEMIQGPSGDYVIGLLALPLVMILDAFVISQFGASPGKAIAGLYVAGTDGDRLPLEASLRRNLLCYLKGMVLGLPLLSLLGYSAGHSSIKEKGFTSWDEDTDSRVFAGSNTTARTFLIAILALSVVTMGRILSKMP